MDELRSWFEVPAIAHFFHIFRGSFDLTDFEIEDFEETLFLDSADNVSSFLPDLVIRLLRGMYKTKDGLQVTAENYDHYLRDLLSHHYVTIQKKENPMVEVDFKMLKTRTKVEILFDVCNWRLELHDAMELTKDLEPDMMRVTPVGRDNDGNTYWYFYGTRLYKEGFSIKTEDMKEEVGPDVKNKSKKKSLKTENNKIHSNTTKSGRAVRKRKMFDCSSQESAEDSERSIEITDDDVEDSKPLKLNLAVTAWSLECSSLSNWNDLVEKLANLRNKSEKELLRNLHRLKEKIELIFHEKDIAYQKKLLAMAPRRVSDRITVKMQQKEQEERLLEQERLLKSQLKAKEAEERHKELEKEREKEREKRYKERERIQEERALRAKLRETQKLVSDNPELVQQIKAVHAGKKRQLHAEDEDGGEEDQYNIMERIMDVLEKDEDAWPFLEPVSEEEAPNYYTLIEKPMDFQTIREKLKKKVYEDKYEFEEDVLLVFDNCETYNGTFSSYTKLALEVKKIFDKLMKREFPPDVEMDDDDFFQVDESILKVCKPKKQKLTSMKPSNVISSKPKTPSNMPNLQNTAMSGITPEFARAQMLQAQARMKQLHQSASILQPTTNLRYIKPLTALLPTRFEIPAGALAKMTPAQMQSLLLKYPKSDFAPSLVKGIRAAGHHFTLSQKIGNLTNSSSNTTPLNPLQQLANTALAPTARQTSSGNVTPLRFPSPDVIVKTVSKTMSHGQVLARFPQSPQLPSVSGIVGRDHLGNSRGRPKKVIVPTAIPRGGISQASYVSALSASGVPVTVKWEDLKKQLVSQMKNEGQNSLVNTNLKSHQMRTTLPNTVGMPGLRPVAVINNVTTATPPGSKTFSFSNVLKSKESPLNGNSLIIQKTNMASSVTSWQSTVTSTVSNSLSLSKVQEWLNSSRPYIGKTSTQQIAKNKTVLSVMPPVNKMFNVRPAVPSRITAPSITSGRTTPMSGSSFTNQINKPQVLMVPQVLKSAAICGKGSVPTVHHTTTVNPIATISNPQPNDLSANKLLELQKAAIQAAAVNQISAKLHTHLTENKTIPSSEINPHAHGIVISPIKMSTLKTSSVQQPALVNLQLSSVPISIIPTATQSIGRVTLFSRPATTSMVESRHTPTAITSSIHAHETVTSTSLLVLPQSGSVSESSPPTSFTSPSQHTLQLSQMILSNATTLPQTAPQAVQFVQIPANAAGLVTSYVRPVNQIVLQQQVNNQSHLIRYVIPAQNSTQQIGNNVLNLNQQSVNNIIDMNQLNGLQNIIVRNQPVANIPTNIRANGNMVTNGTSIQSPQALSLSQNYATNLNVNNSSLVNNQVHHGNETIQIVSNATQVNPNIFPMTQPHATKISLVRTNPIVSKIGQPLSNVISISQPRSYDASLSTKQLSNPHNPVKVQQQLSSPVKLETLVTSPVKLQNGLALVQNSTPSLPANSLSPTIVQSPVVMNPVQLQKLTEEGRIVMMPSGQLIMIPSKDITKIPATIPPK